MAPTMNNPYQKALAAFFCFLVAAAGVVTLSAGTANAAAAPSSVTATPAAVSTAHPYSDPVWFPIHAPVLIGCTGSNRVNNGPKSGSNPCAGDHSGFYAMNIGIPWHVAGGKPNPEPHPAVYAAGSGIVIRAYSGSAACQRNGAVVPGNEVWIAHGGGMVSAYQHLLTVSVKVGQYVTPRSVIGTAGATGAECDSSGKPITAYLDFQVRNKGGSSITATAISVPTLLGCAGTTTSVRKWPATLPRSAYTANRYPIPSSLPKTWVQVPYDSGVAISKADWNCLPSARPSTPNRSATPRVTRSGTTRVVTWPVMPTANRYSVQLQVLRSGSWTTPCSPYVTSGCTYGYYYLASSSKPHLTISGVRSGVSYRVRVSSHNYAGYGLSSSAVGLG